MRHETTFRVRFDESTPSGVLRPSSLLRYVQDAGWQHSNALGLDRAWYARHGVAWLVRALELVVLADVATGALLRIDTAVTGARHVLVRRESRAWTESGETVARACIDWAMVDSTTGAPARIPPAIGQILGARPASFAPLRVPQAGDGPATARLDFAARPQELDPMGHANNAAYLDWLEEAVHAAGLADVLTRTPRRYRIAFEIPAVLGEPLTGRLWVGDAACTWQLVGGAGRSGDDQAGRAGGELRAADGADVDGSPRARADLTFAR